MRVGLPRALLYYRYGKFWERFLSELGVEVVVSGRTDKDVVQKGVGCVSSEVCLPIKIIAGHIVNLADSVDVLFLPRMVWLQDRLFACPKMIGIVDIARMLVGSKTRVVAPAIKGSFLLPHLSAGLALNPNPFRVARALYRARKELGRKPPELEFPPGEKRIALIGHFYNLDDGYVSQEIVATLERQGYRVLRKDSLPPEVLGRRDGFASRIRWVYERELYNAFRYLVDKVDGVCVVVSMGCGPDSLVAEFMREETLARGVPFLELILDEHTGTAGLVTRVEAFVELAQRSKALRRAA